MNIIIKKELGLLVHPDHSKIIRPPLPSNNNLPPCKFLPMACYVAVSLKGPYRQEVKLVSRDAWQIANME